MLMKTCILPQRPGVRLRVSAHCVMCESFLCFITTPPRVLGCTVGGQLIVSPSASTYPAHTHSARSHTYIVPSLESGAQTQTWRGGREMDRQKREEKKRRRIQEGGYSGASLAPGMERCRNGGIK